MYLDCCYKSIVLKDHNYHYMYIIYINKYNIYKYNIIYINIIYYCILISNVINMKLYFNKYVIIYTFVYLLFYL